MDVGYLCVSPHDQTHALQRDALQAAGCERTFEDTVTGAKDERPGLTEALESVQPGDTLVVWRLDRLGGSLHSVIGLINDIHGRGVGFKSLTEQINTTSSDGPLIVRLFAALAECERNLMRERTQAGRAAARARGRKGGRPKKLDTHKAELAQQLYNDKSNSISDICQTLGISRATLYRYITAKTSASAPSKEPTTREVMSL